MFVTTDTEKGSFLLEYRGSHHHMKDMEEKIKFYKEQGLSYVYEYEVNGVEYWYVC